ncbi:MAG TPA: undecaprenyl-diphosphate phosphatase [Terrimicrobiaceae bacterium]|jgi:undecaprenyl-diphosphatase|nr:undecaprenyl-diphosphate phosphatase [Terrimicrobiaceae bacterium]
MDWWKALILGIVEGLTEYLPVSSTGHLLLTQRALGIAQSASADAFAICIQAGAIVAVLGLYFSRVRQMVLGVLGKDPEGLKMATNVIAAFLPAAFIGLLLEKPIKKYLFGGEAWGLWPIVAAWFVGGIAILLVSWWQASRQEKTHQSGLSLESLTWKMAVVVGLIQCIAMWPGVSRSLVTIVGGVLVGLSLSAAVEFSFLLGLLTLSAATVYDGLKYGEEMVQSFGLSALFVGFLGAWVSAVLAVKWMVAYLKKHGMQVFGYYRIALGLVVTVLILGGWLSH